MTKEITRAIIILEIEGDVDDAAVIVNRVLEAGDLQDAINNHGDEDRADLLVTSAMMTSCERVL